MNAGYFRTLFDYNYWARDRLLVALEDMPEADYARENGFTYRSVRGILTHCFDVEYSWRCRLQGEPDEGVLQEEALATPALLAEQWSEEESKMRATSPASRMRTSKPMSCGWHKTGRNAGCRIDG